jgi:AhpD family alkylhydroperoxidase
MESSPTLQRSDGMKEHFHKRIFSAASLLKDLGYMLVRWPRIAGALLDREVDPAFREKILLVTSAVNDCDYCSWFHARQAVASGVSAEEVGEMFRLQFRANASPRELTALLYAQHFVETDRNPDAEMTARLFDDYGERTAKHILALIRAICFGNLFGNTWDAVLSRFKGNPAKASSMTFELVFFALVFWFMWVPTLLTKQGPLEGDRRRGATG